jgi:hypothetical protein
MVDTVNVALTAWVDCNIMNIRIICSKRTRRS